MTAATAIAPGGRLLVRPAYAREVTDASTPSRPDTSAALLEGLRGGGAAAEEAVAALHAMLLRGAHHELGRRREQLAGVPRGEVEDLATQAADDAVAAIVAKLHTFRGDSRFTTWAYKFAVLEAGTKVRRRAWQEREMPLEEEGWSRLPDRRAAPAGDLETAELLGAVRDAIADALTPHQRTVLVAVTLNDVPIDVLAERLATTRGALYKTLHDARKSLRARLAEQGLEGATA